MAFREWFHPPRHVLTIFLGVAVVSAGALGWLSWLLVAQDKALDVQRRQERLEQAADRATAVMQGALADLELRLTASSARTSETPPGVVIVIADPTGIMVHPDSGLLYSPSRSGRPTHRPHPLSRLSRPSLRAGISWGRATYTRRSLQIPTPRFAPVRSPAWRGFTARGTVLMRRSPPMTNLLTCPACVSRGSPQGWSRARAGPGCSRTPADRQSSATRPRGSIASSAADSGS